MALLIDRLYIAKPLEYLHQKDRDILSPTPELQVTNTRKK